MCIALAMATIAIPVSQDGDQRWICLTFLLPATIVAGSLLKLFLRHAGITLEFKSRWARN